ncbi:glycoside hydrolase family 73 protein [Flavilitoribacter nigricans]|uniref:Mannosyl-glycoprotein endo-beta-N-acetylglucosamidase n=1 Tax=Flavilitoribacter nigricans (strain ATCC 23147 / DSM 23189 / NBRC 102662 / NCIMB 1420 / SS-2) TaxID=1122177 RepID=A0A2D0NJA7_FLAN2|nr:glucosaminidase domain-containing protein [Flavilitoribacter nigricans]PHN08537.1 mannosyl-glycoprotein endo-beta-N-acetylglucosamidase [Flavilitoribacter nigricans DSM 23189 = NBRC 102662]
MTNFTHSAQRSAPVTIVLPAYFRRIRENWFNLLILGLLIHLLFQKDITIRFQLHDRDLVAAETSASPTGPSAKKMSSIIPIGSLDLGEEESLSQEDERLANTFSNLTFVLNPAYAKRKNVPKRIVARKIENCRDYVRRYAAEAQQEMRDHGIPASITLAQGLLESNAGDSRLARESNNHFGIKCRSKCRGCTCRNYTDDDIYDMFRVFEQPLASYQEHSKLLTSKRYRHLAKLGRTNYRDWAFGLKKAGYATDKRYAEKLIRIIEELELDRYDS